MCAAVIMFVAGYTFVVSFASYIFKYGSVLFAEPCLGDSTKGTGAKTI